jgi:hypothetical protein
MKSSEGLSKETLYEDLFKSLEQQFPVVEEVKPLSEWCLSLPVVLDGRPFTFDKHEYLKEPYLDTHADQTFMKAAQLGLTSLAMLRAVYNARFRGFRGILYLFPSRSDVIDFSKGRVSPLIDDNPETLGKWIKETDAAGIKQIHNCFVYFRGMKSRSQLKSVPVDMLIADELDEASPMSLDMAMERMSHSEHKEVLKLSNPTIPDYGIDAAFQQTDQRYWLLKCYSCKEYTCLEDTFPECLKETSRGVIRSCVKCGKKLDPSRGEWVPKKPGVIDKRGYHFSQLFSHYVEPGDILHQFRTTANLQDFYNLKIGNAYVEAENRLSIEEVLALCGSEGIESSDPGPCFMGVDQGKDLHVVIGKKHPGKAGQIIHLGIYKDWEELDRLMRVFSVSRCVVDALPETRNARAFGERHNGKVYLNYYSQYQKGSYTWNESQMVVTSNRTESLDASHNEVMAGEIILPRQSDMVKVFAGQLHNVAKKLEEDEDTGSKRYVYVKLGADHFRHAFNYEVMARQSCPEFLFPSL